MGQSTNSLLIIWPMASFKLTAARHTNSCCVMLGRWSILVELLAVLSWP
jgi:hypothetical protein